jgi:hypothetical protein
MGCLAIHYCDARIRRAEIDADDFSHDSCAFSDIRSLDKRLQLSAEGSGAKTINPRESRRIA